jgi:hypothetical protein
MLARLGDVLYWAACGLAVLFLLLSASVVVFGEGDSRTFGITWTAVLGVLVWLFGRACRYVLAGR